MAAQRKDIKFNISCAAFFAQELKYLFYSFGCSSNSTAQSIFMPRKEKETKADTN
jgi:hypothetical protein